MVCWFDAIVIYIIFLARRSLNLAVGRVDVSVTLAASTTFQLLPVNLVATRSLGCLIDWPAPPTRVGSRIKWKCNESGMGSGLVGVTKLLLKVGARISPLASQFVGLEIE